MLERMLPSIEAWTILIFPWTRAMMKTINSTALPKLTFIKAPNVCPVFNEISSVAKLSNYRQRESREGEYSG